MKDNKHPHHDLIVEWAKDTSKEIMESLDGEDDWIVGIYTVISDEDGLCSFKFKPREFIKGHWYPCVLSKTKFEVLMTFEGSSFVSSPLHATRWSENSFKWIGKSLGAIKFEE